MPMPLIETVSLITALASALQTLRSGRPANESPLGADASDASAVVLAYDSAKAAYDSALQRIDMANRHLNILAGAACVVTLTTVLVVKATNSEVNADSPLLIAALVLSMVVAISPVLARGVSVVKLVSGYPALGGRQAKPLVELMDDFIRLAAPCTAHNERVLRFRNFAADVLMVCLAVNVLLLALWALSV
jgi:hypothetical protein